MFRFLILVVAAGIGVIVAVAIRSFVMSFLGSYDTSAWGTLTTALVGLIPVVFIIFVAFVNPARRFLKGDDPMGKQKEEPRPPKRRYYEEE